MNRERKQEWDMSGTRVELNQIREERLEELIQTYRRPLLICAGKVLHRFVTESDEEWSDILLAFREAVQAYEPIKGAFWPFASTVVSRRLTDHLRRTYARSQMISVEPQILTGEAETAEDSGGGIAQEVRENLTREAAQTGDWPGQYTITDEIEALQEELKPYGFTLFDLTASSPKAEKSKKKCADAVAAILKDPGLLQKLQEMHALPIKELESRYGISRKILDKHRRYLIAAVLIMQGEYPLLTEYMGPVREALKA